VHGSGPETREYILPWARVLIRRGIAVLGYDKRGDGRIHGDCNTASFDDLADDVVAAFEYLKTRSDIDPTQIGLLGVSQAGWIMPLAAVRAKDLAFLISISGAGLPPAETTSIRQFARTGQGWDEYASAREQLAVRAGFLHDRSKLAWQTDPRLRHVREEAARPSVRLSHRSLTLTVRPGSSGAKRAAVMHEWHKSLLHEVAGYFLQRMKTNSGSRNHRARNIRLNTELVKKPKDLLEYVVVHEMLHLIEPTQYRAVPRPHESALPRVAPGKGRNQRVASGCGGMERIAPRGRGPVTPREERPDTGRRTVAAVRAPGAGATALPVP
jgi:hypothetical protein